MHLVTVNVTFYVSVIVTVTVTFSVSVTVTITVTVTVARVSPFVGFLKHREEQLARQREDMDAVCSGYWRGGYEISLEGEEDEVSLLQHVHISGRGRSRMESEEDDVSFVLPENIVIVTYYGV